jgi:hypothetical protein
MITDRCAAKLSGGAASMLAAIGVVVTSELTNNPRQTAKPTISTATFPDARI